MVCSTKIYLLTQTRFQQDFADCFTPIPYSQAAAALRCSSWNKPRTQSFWGWRRSRSSFLCLLRRLLPSVFLFGGDQNKKKKHTHRQGTERSQPAGLNPRGLLTQEASQRWGSALLFTEEEGDKKNKNKKTQIIIFFYLWCCSTLNRLIFRSIYREHEQAACWHLQTQSVKMLL